MGWSWSAVAIALPHYLVVAFFVGSGFYVATEMGSDNGQVLWGGGLIGLLVLIAAVVLLFTGVYPGRSTTSCWA